MCPEVSLHQAEVKAQIASPMLWHVLCVLCEWLGDVVGPYFDADEASRQAWAHNHDPEVELRAATHAQFWASPVLGALTDLSLIHI